MKWKDKNKKKYIGFYVDEETCKKINFMACAKFDGNRSDYIASLLRKDLSKNYAKAVSSIKTKGGSHDN